MSRDAYSYEPQDERHTSRSATPKRHRPLVSAVAEATERSAGMTSGGISLALGRAPLKPERLDSPEAFPDRDRTLLLRESELRMLSEIAAFRVVPPRDLAEYAYRGDAARMERDLRHLKQLDLLNEHTVEVSRKKVLRLLTLTKKGQQLLRQSGQVSSDQATYHGLAKPKEAEHDAALYRLYQKEAARIESEGGRPVRMILDYELKRNLNRDLATLSEEQPDVAAEREEIARRHGLQVIDGKIALPDLRIEYVNAELEPRHIDLDLVTSAYRPRGISEKAKAGFTLYSLSEDSPRVRRILEDRDLIAEILSL